MKLSFLTKLLSFNPSDLFNESLRFRKLLKNADVIRMLKVAHLYGELHKSAEMVDPPQVKNYTFDKLLDELQN
jgi:hypothetical protein